MTKNESSITHPISPILNSRTTRYRDDYVNRSINGLEIKLCFMFRIDHKKMEIGVKEVIRKVLRRSPNRFFGISILQDEFL